MRNGDYFTALCLKKYKRSLQNAVWDKDRTLDPRAILDGISKGSKLLHDTLGLVHNDINPANIMLDDHGSAVIIDFDFCMPIGQEIGHRKWGTFEMDPVLPGISVPESDIYGLTASSWRKTFVRCEHLYRPSIMLYFLALFVLTYRMADEEPEGEHVRYAGNLRHI